MPTATKTKSTKRAHPRWWSEAEHQIVYDGLASGLSVGDITQRLPGRSEGAIYTYVETQLNGVRAFRDTHTYATRSAVGVGLLMGVSRNRVETWIEYGFLRATRNRVRRTRSRRKRRNQDGRLRRGNRHYLIYDLDLQAFIEDRRWWMLWAPEAINDPTWREHAVEVRQAAGGEWIGSDALAVHYHYSKKRVREWFTDGALKGKGVRVHGRWYIWSTDLHGFTP